MFAYYLLVGLPLLLALLMYSIKYIYRLNEIPYRKEIIRTFFVMYFLLLAFRAETIGVDTWNYLLKFRTAGNSAWSDYVFSRSSEQGYAFLTKLVASVTDSKQVYLTIVALITVYPIAKLYMEESESPLLTIGMYLILPMFQMLFSGIRQAIAMAFIPIVYRSIKEKKLLHFFLAVWFASLFHNSAWVMLALYPVYYAKISRKSMIWVVPALAAVIIFRTQIFVFLFSVLRGVFRQDSATLAETGATSMLMLFSIILAFSYLFLGETDEETAGQRNILVLSVVVQSFAMVNRLAMRVNYYYLLFLPLLFPKVLRRIPYKNRWFSSLVEFVCCVYFLVYFLRKVHGGTGGLGIFPYVPFWNS